MVSCDVVVLWRGMAWDSGMLWCDRTKCCVEIVFIVGWDGGMDEFCDGIVCCYMTLGDGSVHNAWFKDNQTYQTAKKPSMGGLINHTKQEWIHSFWPLRKDWRFYLVLCPTHLYFQYWHLCYLIPLGIVILETDKKGPLRGGQGTKWIHLWRFREGRHVLTERCC